MGIEIIVTKYMAETRKIESSTLHIYLVKRQKKTFDHIFWLHCKIDGIIIAVQNLGWMAIIKHNTTLNIIKLN